MEEKKKAMKPANLFFFFFTKETQVCFIAAHKLCADHTW